MHNNVVAVAVPGCPENFHHMEGHNRCYHVVMINLRWQAASQYCRAINSRAHLVVIDNQQEQQLLATELSRRSSTYRNQIPHDNIYKNYHGKTGVVVINTNIAF